MIKNELAAVVERLSTYLPEVRKKLPIIAFPPFEEILRGLYFERSASDASRFYLWVFFMPMCVPVQQVTFNLGRRIGGKDQRWCFNEPQLIDRIVFFINAEALSFLECVKTPHEAARFALSLDGATKSPHVQQANGYLLARSGEINEAAKSLDELLYLLNLDFPWEAEIAARAQKLKSLLLNAPEDAKAQLRAWEIESIRNLGLESIGFSVTPR